MPRPKTGKPPGRPKGDRTLDAHCYVRMTSEERELVERAAEHAVEGRPMSNRLSVAQWLLKAGIAAAKDELSEKRGP